MNISDRRRILGPSNAKLLTFDKSGPVEIEPISSSSVPNSTSMYIENGLICNANGSSYLEVTGSTSEADRTLMLTSVYGPRPSRGAFNAKATLSVQFKEVTLEKIPAGELKELCNFLSNVFNAVINLERYPKSGIDVFLSLIHSSNGSQLYELESIISTCVNGITLALIDAGIEIFDTVSAGIYEKHIVAFVKNGTEIVGFWKGKDSASESEDILSIIEQCKLDYLKNRKAMVEYLVRCNDKEDHLQHEVTKQ
ncbi:LADA_0C09362g1_1 [Lachancea dasiensis]|uniref:LADA_0C09362g1_1 n=1 Tax=Lachancea dasiensis TaxID=1072105 RepID=A0A1G4J126_9SACH|nr:LADA_0C09362g1_1 [Lachancea dasiensis]